MHLIFYDGECGFCDHWVQCFLSWDKTGQLMFAPLQGETARKLLVDLPEEYRGKDTLILIENFQSDNRRYYIMGKAVLRLFWLLGGWRAWLLGWVSFLPSVLYDWVYRLVARNRHFLSAPVCQLPDPKRKGRFLP